MNQDAVPRSARLFSLLVLILVAIYEVPQSLDELASMSPDELDALLWTMRVYSELPTS